ncbi:hypothetical protein KSP40_PGU016103 [Platanthera guangdongensis]|uniref:Uncharacterized protein n=1 Tax=Platanthera guangdongensis TaxID=2320717 RepID=A0ABR2LKN0_9ASPA
MCVFTGAVFQAEIMGIPQVCETALIPKEQLTRSISPIKVYERKSKEITISEFGTSKDLLIKTDDIYASKAKRFKIGNTPLIRTSLKLYPGADTSFSNLLPFIN